MNVPNRHSIIERIQEQSAFTVFQPNFFNNSSFEPDSLEDFDFETAPNYMTTHHPTLEEDEPIPHSSGLTSNSNVTSYASTAPILQQQKHNQTLSTATEEYCLKPMNDDSQETLKTIGPNDNDPQSNDYYRRSQQQEVLNKRNSSSPAARSGKPVRNYQIFPGHTRFLCGGRLVTSKDYRAFIAGLLIFLTPVVLFSIFTCPFLWQQVHPALPIIFAYIFVLAFVSMLKTSWTDPGIIPRNLDPVLEQLAQNERGSMDSDAPPKEIMIKNTSYSLRYCDTCKIYRPPRASHCRQCDNCVEYEDHHCAWLNNCIGKRNYRSFFTFILACAMLCIYVIASVIYQLLFYANQHDVDQPMNNFSYVFSKAPVSFVLAIYCFILLWLVGGLTLYHCTLILRGVTTHEQIRAEIMKAKYPELHVNPYNKLNPFKNMLQVLCQPQPKSYLRRRKLVEPAVEKY